MLALLVLGQVVFSPDGGGGALVRKLVCGGALTCNLEGGTGNLSAAAGATVPGACGAAQSLTSNGSALVCADCAAATSTSAQTLLVLQAFSASAQTAACTSACNATQLPVEIEGTFIVNGSGGTVALQAASSTAGQTVTVFRGSYCRVF